jgi:hypothetical protein
MSEESEYLDKAEEQLLVIGKAIEHSKLESKVSGAGESSNKELAKRFAKALQDLDEGHTEEVDIVKGKKQEPLWKKAIKLFFAKKNAAKESKESKDKQSGQGSAFFGKGDSVAILSAELEIAISHLKSASKIDSTQNDLAVTQDMELVMKLSSKLASKVTSVRKTPQLERAGLAIADISVAFKNNSASVAMTSEKSQSLNMAGESMGESTELHIRHNTADIRSALSQQTSVDGSPRNVPITQEAKLKKERENQEFSSYQVPKKSGS